jgi:trehalose/maltose hydrolase-like predicted phosphorylase
MLDSWIYKESPCQYARRLGTDALFTLGNGYLGCRGFFEEEQEGVEALGGIYMAGVFGAGDLKAWRGTHRELVNTPNFLWMSITVDGEAVLVRPGRISRYARTLDMHEGVLGRRLVWRSARGIRVQFDFERFISVDDLHVAGQRLRITPLNGTPQIDVVCGIDARVTQHNMVTTIPLPVQPGRRQLKTLRQTADTIEALVDTLPGGVRIAEGQQVILQQQGADPQDGVAADTDGRAARRFSFSGAAGMPVTLTKTVAFYTSRDGDPAALLEKRMSRTLDYDRLLERHRAAWLEKWHAADIEIDGPPDDQQALRFNLFHLMQASPSHDWRVSLGARGLSGEMHEGSVFWDNEIFKLPFFTFTDPAATRSMLRFRHHTLPEARRHARDLWLDGAMFAWKSGVDGVEETEMGVGAYYAIHIIADIAYALRQYWEATGDDDFMNRYGVEILIETARFWTSRASRDPLREGYHILAVRGPNEYDVIVNNNAFTNMMAQENLLFALDTIARLKRKAPAVWQRLATRLKVEPRELGAWKRCASGLVIPYDKTRDLYAEDDMYLHRVPFDRKRGKPDARRVIDSTLPYEAMAYYQITKQSDVITMMNLLPGRFTAAQQRNAYGFYEPRTVHDSSLSFAPHAIMAARLGMRGESYRYFRECAYLDIADLQLNTVSGLHLANLGGTWQAVILGFAGLRMLEGIPHLDPHLPPPWKALRFRLRYRGALLRVDITRRGLSVTLEEAGTEPVALCLGCEPVTLTEPGETRETKRGRAGGNAVNQA